MNLDPLNVTLKHKADLSIFLLSDTHIGSGHHDGEWLEYWESVFKRTHGLKIIYGLGDYVDTGSTRVGGFDQSMSGDEQINYLIDFLKPYKDYIRVLAQGNHEARFKKEFNTSIINIVGETLGVPTTDGHFFDTLRINGQDFTVYGRHGNKTSAKLHLMMGGWERSTDHIDANLLVSGHCHHCQSWERTVMDKADLKQRVYALGGHMLNYNGSYADDMGLAIHPPSFMKLSVNRDLKVSAEKYYNLKQEALL